ncbi:MAG: LicD family protein [Lachnospiraceae bacterium]|nr:LicD family protein [Lachnospiraceae bacterium]
METASIEFFRDEVRSGFYVPTAIKQAWGAELTVLAEIDRICKKYGIEYHAEWGSLLGAVRHGGFIPWDDDLDIGMKRADYIRFKQVADKELPKEFAIHDYERREDYWLFCSKVINTSRVCFDEEHLKKNHNFPYMATIDVFVLDYLYRDAEKEKERCDEVLYLFTLAKALAEKRITPEAAAPMLAAVGEKYGDKPDISSPAIKIAKALYCIAEKQMMRVPEEESDSIGQIFPWIMKGGKGLPKEIYDRTVRLPFEYTEIPVPASYDRVLEARYGDYFTVHKIWSGHGYPYFERQKQALYAIDGFDMPEFCYDGALDAESRSGEQASHQDATLRETSKGCAEGLESLVESISHALGEGRADEALNLLAECQQLAADFGTLVEKVKGEDNPCSVKVVEALQGLCDAVYSLYQEVSGGGDDRQTRGMLEMVKSSAAAVALAVQTQITAKKMSVFVTLGAEEWKAFQNIYRRRLSEGADVYVLPIPVLEKDPLGNVSCTVGDATKTLHINEYPQSVHLSDWSSFNIELLHPDEIYIQNPYDGENPCLTVPDRYYALNLKKHTERLVFVPPFSVEEFQREDTTTIYNMKHYVTAPGVMYADEIFVQSENMRELYIEKLTEFAGEATKALWERKLSVMVNSKSGEAVKGKRSRLLFGIGLNELTEEKDKLPAALESRLEAIKDRREDLQTDVCLYPQNKDEWERTDKRLMSELTALLGKYADEGIIGMCEEKITSNITEKYDAYYGSPSPAAHWFNYAGKPVMIMKF